MESVGRLAGGVAHDFNNMLGVIIGHAELAMEQAEPESQVHADLQEILKAAGRSADLTRQLLAFSRQQTISPKELNLSDAIADMLKMLNRLIGEDVQLKFVPGKDLWPVKMDPSQVDQVLANLCVNARDAIADVGTITIETDNCTLDEDFCATHAGAVPGEYVRLTVSDTGCGMDKETIAHIFEPFFTTKEVGKGTGLGLATVYGIASQNGGFIDAYSEPGMGTRIAIHLPRYLSTAAGERVEGAATPHVRGHETILLVEDEPAILKMTKSLLERQGYTVLAASTPADALRLAGEHAIHLLMTDVIMPKMNGRELAGILKASHPHLRVLFMSGYTASVISQHGVLDPGVCFIQKPFSLRDLAATVRRALDQDDAHA
jgi:CheY-like chemotaxis protein